MCPTEYRRCHWRLRSRFWSRRASLPSCCRSCGAAVQAAVASEPTANGSGQSTGLGIRPSASVTVLHTCTAQAKPYTCVSRLHRQKAVGPVGGDEDECSREPGRCSWCIDGITRFRLLQVIS